MGQDLCLKTEAGVLNVRVGAIIMRDGKFLMAGNDSAAHLYSVGGRIQFGETAEEAVIREVFEETGVKMEIDRLGFIHENFFWGDESLKKDNVVHELSFFFYMKVPADFNPLCQSTTGDGHREHLCWISPDESRLFYPEFFRTELKNPSAGVKHFVTKDL